MAGKRVDLSMLGDLTTTDQLTPAVGGPTMSPSRSVAPIAEVRSNPRNSRDLDSPRTKAAIARLAASISELGQIEPCTVVTAVAYLGIFPEDEPLVGAVRYVQVSGACRRAAIDSLGLDTIKVHVDDDLARSRATFLAAAARENLDREGFDPIEEAHSVKGLAAELGSQAAVAQQLGRTAPWVTQRVNLLRLDLNVQQAIRFDEPPLPLREVRYWHTLSREDQLVALARWRMANQPRAPLTAVNGADPAPPAPARMSAMAVAVRRLGEPVRAAAVLFEHMDRPAVQELVDQLNRLLEQQPES
jgi:ParB family chromosome partitioning protein